VSERAYMPHAEALPILQELGSFVRRSELLSSVLDMPSELIEEALALACKEMLINIIAPRRTSRPAVEGGTNRE
jgi:hypothetical protein